MCLRAGHILCARRCTSMDTYDVRVNCTLCTPDGQPPARRSHSVRVLHEIICVWIQYHKSSLYFSIFETNLRIVELRFKFVGKFLNFSQVIVHTVSYRKNPKKVIIQIVYKFCSFSPPANEYFNTISARSNFTRRDCNYVLVKRNFWL